MNLLQNNSWDEQSTFQKKKEKSNTLDHFVQTDFTMLGFQRERLTRGWVLKIDAIKLKGSTCKTDTNN